MADGKGQRAKSHSISHLLISTLGLHLFFGPDLLPRTSVLWPPLFVASGFRYLRLLRLRASFLAAGFLRATGFVVLPREREAGAWRLGAFLERTASFFLVLAVGFRVGAFFAFRFADLRMVVGRLSAFAGC